MAKRRDHTLLVSLGVENSEHSWRKLASGVTRWTQWPGHTDECMARTIEIDRRRRVDFGTFVHEAYVVRGAIKTGSYASDIHLRDSRVSGCRRGWQTTGLCRFALTISTKLPEKRSTSTVFQSCGKLVRQREVRRKNKLELTPVGSRSNEKVQFSPAWKTVFVSVGAVGTITAVAPIARRDSSASDFGRGIATDAC